MYFYKYNILSISFSPDNQYFATGSLDEIVRIYEINNQFILVLELN